MLYDNLSRTMTGSLFPESVFTEQLPFVEVTKLYILLTLTVEK